MFEWFSIPTQSFTNYCNIQETFAGKVAHVRKTITQIAITNISYYNISPMLKATTLYNMQLRSPLTLSNGMHLETQLFKLVFIKYSSDFNLFVISLNTLSDYPIGIGNFIHSFIVSLQFTWAYAVTGGWKRRRQYPSSK